MSTSGTTKALLYKVSGGADPNAGDPGVITVQFNPTSLSYSVQNTLEKKGKDAKAQQFVAQTTAKLEFDLIFDDTHDGIDVRSQTDAVKKLLDPGGSGTPQASKDKAPPVIGFRWGTFKFKGLVESFKETLEFFSQDGVPLRSSIKLAMSAQDPKDIFTDESFDTTAAGGVSGGDVQLASVPPGGVQKTAEAGGNRNAARAIGAANGLESLRDPGSAVVAVSASVQLNAAVAFSTGASASAGFGIGGGIGGGLSIGGGIGGGIGVSGGISIGASAGISAGVSVGASAGVGLSAGLPGSASAAGIAATAGAFNGLRVGVSTPSASLDLSRLAQPPAPSAGVSFGIGGRVSASTSPGLASNVGASARIRFD